MWACESTANIIERVILEKFSVEIIPFSVNIS